MQYVNFGSAGVKVSQLALGLGLRGQSSPDEAQRLIEHAIDQGINLIDCANTYAMMDTAGRAGESETILGRVLQSRRDEVVITSKVNETTGPGPNDYGSSRNHIMREIERSLRNLKTDHIDVYILHVFDATTPQAEAVRVLDDLVRQGKVRYTGCSNFTPWRVCKALWLQDQIGADPFICIQNQYSLLNRSLEAEMFDLLQEQGLGMMAFSPLRVGLLSGRYQPGQDPPPGSFWAAKPRDLYDQLFSGHAANVFHTVQTIANQRGKTVAQVALNWVISQPQVTLAISGSDTIEQIDENLGAIGWQLTQAERQSLDEASRPIQNPPPVE